MSGVFLLGVALFLSMQEAHCQVSYNQLRSFGYPDQSGSDPNAALLVGTDGVLYGTASAGGMFGGGVLFRINSDGTGYAVLHNFGSPSGDGTSPQATLIQGSDGSLYGSTWNGGTNSGGILFKIRTDGGGYQVLHTFNSFSGDGYNSRTPLMQSPDGVLYGVTWYGGSTGGGTIFRLNTDGSGYAVVMSFQKTTDNWGNPANRQPNGLTTSDGITLYGTTAFYTGTLFSVSTNGTSFTILHSFSGANGEAAPNELTLSSDGNLYGTTFGRTQSGGNMGTVFTIRLDGTGYSVLHTFDTNVGGPVGKLVSGLDGSLYGVINRGEIPDSGACFSIHRDGTGYVVLPQSGPLPHGPKGLVQGADATLFGTANGDGFGTLFKLRTDGSDDTIVHYFFSGGGGDGLNPRGPLVWDDDGFLYGTTSGGGSNALGTVFRMFSDGSAYSVIHSFTYFGSDGRSPNALLLGSDGMLYGAASGGGAFGGGVLFRMNRDGTGYSVLRSFGSPSGDGTSPQAPLIQGSDDVLYGTTYSGGSAGYGTLFSIQTNGTGYTLLHTFGSGLDGTSPSRALLQGADGCLYGMSVNGGTNGFGTVYKINTGGTGYAILKCFTFQGEGLLGNEGYNPVSLIQGSDGLLYGATYSGGGAYNGTLWKMDTNGNSFSLVWTFSQQPSNARYLFERTVQGPDGAIYAATAAGGSSDQGTFFKVQTNGTGFSLLHNFGAAGGDGQSPFAPICLGGNGTFYGTTQYGGARGVGTIFAIGPSASPTIVNQPESTRVPRGADASFRVTASGGDLRYQWYFNAVPMPNATNATVFLPAIERTNNGIYCVWVANLIGGVLSSNASLSVVVAQQLFGPVLHPDGFELRSQFEDGWPLASQDLTNFEVQTSSNLLDWSSLPGAPSLTLSNGILLLLDTNRVNAPTRFYRVLQH